MSTVSQIWGNYVFWQLNGAAPQEECGFLRLPGECEQFFFHPVRHDDFLSGPGGPASQSLIMTGNLVVGVMISLSLQTLGQFRRTCCHSLFPPPTNRGMEQLLPPTWTSRGGLKWFFHVINARLEISCVLLRKSASLTKFCFPASRSGLRGATEYCWGQYFHLHDICLIFWQVVGQTRAFSQAGDWCGNETGFLRGRDLSPGGRQLWAFAGM